eukprot:1160679-Pelagomonas_calceolata.AAC.24
MDTSTDYPRERVELPLQRIQAILAIDTNCNCHVYKLSSQQVGGSFGTIAPMRFFPMKQCVDKFK